MRRTGAIILVLLLCSVFSASGQYYSWGGSPASVRWRSMRTPDVRMIYPSGGGRLASRMLFYMDTVRRSVGYGFDRGPMRIPVVMHTGNMVSNGIVMWAPKRMDIIAAPSIDTYSEPWLKQIACHEYRHAVQYNNINRGMIRILGYLLGQQAPLVGLVQIPIWYIEGDAVMAETQMSAFGRALQPSFTLRYRALGGIPRRRWQIDRWFCGSYRHEVPDHYQLGYQIVRYSQCRYGVGMWNDVIRYSARNPYMINPKAVRLRRRYGTNVGRLMRDAFAQLYARWDSLPQRASSARIISPGVRCYTEYSYPQVTDDGRIVALHKDMDDYGSIVLVSADTGAKRRLAHTGAVSTRPALCGGRLYWTEYRRSTLYDQMVYSSLCTLDMSTRKRGVVRSTDNVLYPTPTDDGVFCVDYRQDGTYGIRRIVEMERAVVLPDTVSVHGLAWDDVTGGLYFIGLSDGGMWLGSADTESGAWRAVTPARHITLSSLRAGGGRLYFGSIASGLDEAHMLDLASMTQWRVTDSRFGSFYASPFHGGDSVAVAAYTEDGYMLAVQRLDSLFAVPDAVLPANAVNAPLPQWKAVRMDSIVAPAGLSYPGRRFGKVPHLFNIHSWAPVEFDPYEVMSEAGGFYGAGVTVMSQDLLSSCSGYLSYGYSARGGSRMRLRMEYSGLGPHIGISAQWGGGKAVMYDADTLLARPAAGHYLDVSAYVSVPMLLSGGYHIRRLTPAVDYTYNNGYTVRDGKYARGVHRLTASLQFSDYVRQAVRDFLPRWGYVVRATVTASPFVRDFRTLAGIYAAGYLPGAFAHHSVLVRANYQRDFGGGRYGFRRKELFPRGFIYDFSAERFVAASLDYQLPLCYPDWGIPSVVFIKRIRLDVWGDWAGARMYGRSRDFCSWGGEFIFDVCPFRLPSQATTQVKVGAAVPVGGRGVVVSGGVSLSL